MEFKNINVRAPKALVDAIDDMARIESQRTGLPVDRSGIIRRAIETDLERRKQAASKEGRDGQ